MLGQRHPKTWCSGETKWLWNLKLIIFISSLQKKSVIACDSEIILQALLKSKLILTKLKSFDCWKNHGISVILNVKIYLKVILSDLTGWGRVVHAAPSEKCCFSLGEGKMSCHLKDRVTDSSQSGLVQVSFLFKSSSWKTEEVFWSWRNLWGFLGQTQF